MDRSGRGVVRIDGVDKGQRVGKPSFVKKSRQEKGEKEKKSRHDEKPLQHYW